VLFYSIKHFKKKRFRLGLRRVGSELCPLPTKWGICRDAETPGTSITVMKYFPKGRIHGTKRSAAHLCRRMSVGPFFEAKIAKLGNLKGMLTVDRKNKTSHARISQCLGPNIYAKEAYVKSCNIRCGFKEKSRIGDICVGRITLRWRQTTPQTLSRANITITPVRSWSSPLHSHISDNALLICHKNLGHGALKEKCSRQWSRRNRRDIITRIRAPSRASINSRCSRTEGCGESEQLQLNGAQKCL
jgi:hypothetical protein